MNDVAAYGALIISLLTIAGSAAKWLLERRRRNRDGDVDNVDRLLERIQRMEAQQALEYTARQKLQADLWSAQGRIYQLELAQKRDARLITLALEYIELLSDQVVEAGGKPPAKPPELIEWLNRSHKGD